MARRFQASEWVDHGSAAGIDSLAAAAFGGWAWVKRTSNGTNQHIITKWNSGAEGWAFKLSTSGGEGTLDVTVGRTVDANAVANAVVPLWVWKFVAFDFDSGASPSIRMFVGGIATTVAEVTYATQTSGSGTPDSDAAASLYVGSIQIITSLSFLGEIQRGGIVTGSRPGASGFETIRAATLSSASNNPSTADLLASASHVLAFDYQDGSLTDLTGNGHNGTATGATAVELLTKLNLYEGVGAAGRIQGQAMSRSTLY